MEMAWDNGRERRGPILVIDKLKFQIMLTIHSHAFETFTSMIVVHIVGSRLCVGLGCSYFYK